MSKVVFGLDDLSRLYHEVNHPTEVKQLQAHSRQDYAEAKVAYKRKLIESCHAVYVIAANALRSCIKMLIRSIFIVINFFGVEKIDPKIYLSIDVPGLKMNFHFYPLVECHSKNKWEKSDDIEDTDQEQAVSDYPFAGLVEFL